MPGARVKPHRFPAHRAPRPVNPDAGAIASEPGLIRFARYLARQAARRHRHDPGLNDPHLMESAALLGLARAARDYDPAGGVALSTYVGHRIKYTIIDEIRIASRLRGRSGESSPRFYPLDPEMEGPDTPLHNQEFVEIRDQVEHLLSRLSPTHATVMRLLYLDPDHADNPGAVAETLGISRNTVTCHHIAAIKSIRAALRWDGLGVAP